METVLDALKAMEKATYREVAARLDIEPLEALNMLREQREQGLCDFYDGAWSLDAAKSQARKSVLIKREPLAKGITPAPVDPEIIRQLLKKNGAMSTAALANEVNRNSRGMVSVMISFERQGVVVKCGEGKGVTWSLPCGVENEKGLKRDVSNSNDNRVGMGTSEKDKPVAGETTQQNSIQEPIHGKEKSISEIVNDIPAFTSRPDDLVIPSARFISDEIRRTKTKLNNLQKLQGAMRELRRHKNLLESMSND